MLNSLFKMQNQQGGVKWFVTLWNAVSGPWCTLRHFHKKHLYRSDPWTSFLHVYSHTWLSSRSHHGNHKHHNWK